MDVIKEHKISNEVLKFIENVLDILDSNYGSERSIEDDGGYVALIIGRDSITTEENYQEILDKHNLIKEYAEFEDVICSDVFGTVWCSDLYIVGNEYGISIIYKRKEE